MSNKVIRNKRGETFVVVEDHRERLKLGSALRSPDASRDYDTLKERFAARLAAEASLGQRGERQLDEKTIERVYDEFLRDDIEPLARPELEEMVQEIYHEARAGYRGGERTERGAIAAVAETFSRAVEQRTTQERLTETLLEDVYKKTHRAFLEQGAYHLIPELQTIYLGALVKLRTRGHVTDSELLEAAERAERPKVTKPKKEERVPEQPEETLATIQEDLANSYSRVDRLATIQKDLDGWRSRLGDIDHRMQEALPKIHQESHEDLSFLREAIKKRIDLADLYNKQAERIALENNNPAAYSIITLFEHTVQSVAHDYIEFDDLISEFLAQAREQEAPPIAGTEDQRASELDLLISERKKMLARWNPLSKHLGARKQAIDVMQRMGTPDQEASARRMYQALSDTQQRLTRLRVLEDMLSAEYKKKGSLKGVDEAQMFSVEEYRNALVDIINAIAHIEEDARYLGLLS